MFSVTILYFSHIFVETATQGLSLVCSMKMIVFCCSGIISLYEFLLL